MKKSAKTALTNRTQNLNEPVSSIAIRNSTIGSRFKLKRQSRTSSVDMTEDPVAGPSLKVYVYIQLKQIVNLPHRPGGLELELVYNKTVIPRLDNECSGGVPCILRDGNAAQITFSFPIVQDSVEDLNIGSDQPIMIALYERKTRSTLDMEEEGLEGEGEEYREVIAQSYIDLLAHFTKRRSSVITETFIYPINKEDQMCCGTCKATWHIYTLLPLLKNMDFSNVIFINFESLYNCTEDLLDEPEDLMADIAFRSLIPNDHGDFEVNVICSYSGFSKNVIADQNPCFTWEAAKSSEAYTKHSFGFQSESKVNIYRLFKRLLRPEYSELHLKDIDVVSDVALVCNSMHRFVLTEELRSLLEDVFVFKQQQLFVRLYRIGSPEEILLEGILEPSVLLYPFVNAVRFAVELQPVPKTRVSGNNKSRRTKKDSVGGGDDSTSKPVFAIVSICLLSPLTEALQSLAKYVGKKEKLAHCRRIYSKTIMAPLPILRERAYDEFDAWVSDAVDYIVKNNIRDVKDAKNFFCCQLENGCNKILKLIALDFNQQYPTKTNIEFRNLMTTVYKELVDRAYNIVQNCGSKDLRQCLKAEQEFLVHTLQIMDFAKYAYEASIKEFGDFLLEKLRDRYSKNVTLNFYTFLMNVEQGNFIEAKEYIAKPLKDKELAYDYFTKINEVYIEYMDNLKAELVYNEPYEKLLIKLQKFLQYYSRDIDCWILLYCLYKNSGYLPGMEFARWHYDDLCDLPQRIFEEAPLSRWRIYCDYEIPFESKRSILFYKTVKVFQSIGAYKFAQFVFEEIANECSEADRFIVMTTFKIFLNEVEPNTVYGAFPTANSEQKAVMALVNGNLAFHREEIDRALQYYESLLDMLDAVDQVEPFELGIRRYAEEMQSQGHYEKAIEAMKKCCYSHGTCIISSYFMGQLYYKIGKLEEAEEHFAHSTQYKIHIPDAWAYLALINLRLGRNFNALECWKYAKLAPETVIADEILEELNKIDFHDVDLYVDKPI